MKKSKPRPAMTRLFTGDQIKNGIISGIVSRDVLNGRKGTFDERMSLEQHLSEKESPAGHDNQRGFFERGDALEENN